MRPYMVSDPLLAELWIVGLCSIVNRAPARLHADVLFLIHLRAVFAEDVSGRWS